MTQTPFLSLRDLQVSFDIAGTRVTAVDGVSLDIAPGQSVGIVGESGSGKSTLARALLGLLPGGSSVRLGGTLAVDGTSIPLTDVARLRGKSIAMVFQDPLSSLDPLMRIGDQIGEAVRQHDRGTACDSRVASLLDMVKLPSRACDSYPHEMSGGMRQRALLAIALACKPRLLIADEPTTALDVTTQKEILDLIKSVRTELDMGLLLISHDLSIVSALCDQAHMMVKGRFIESGSVAEMFLNPTHAYSKSLLAAARATGETGNLRSPAPPPAAHPVLDVTAVWKTFRTRGGGEFQALKGVDIAVGRGETLALVGESGSGKSTLARVALALTIPEDGDIRLNGTSISRASPRELRRMRTAMQPVFQDAGAAFNPRRTVAESLRRAFISEQMSRTALDDAVVALLEQVRLSPGRNFLDRYPHELSGGQRQRLGIARALAAKPLLIVADEPLSGADVSIRSQVIDLLVELQERTGVAYLFITHDIWLARTFAHRVAVMHQGRIVEQGSAEQVTGAPAHDYSKRLLTSTLTVTA